MQFTYYGPDGEAVPAYGSSSPLIAIFTSENKISKARGLLAGGPVHREQKIQNCESGTPRIDRPEASRAWVVIRNSVARPGYG